MPSSTPRGYPYPLDNSDPPDGGAQIQALAQAVDTDVQTIDDHTAAMPVGDDSNTVRLTSGDIRLTGSAETVILSSTFTLTQAQNVYLAGKARMDNSGGATGGVGLHIAVDGAQQPASHSGPVDIGAGGRTMQHTGMIAVSLNAGSHTVQLRANRDATGQIDATASGLLTTGPTYRSCELTVIV